MLNKVSWFSRSELEQTLPFLSLTGCDPCRFYHLATLRRALTSELIGELVTHAVYRTRIQMVRNELRTLRQTLGTRRYSPDAG